MVEETLQVLFWTWPVLLGLIFWLAKAHFAVRFMDRLDAWIAAEREHFRASSSRFARYYLRPVLATAHVPFIATTRISNPFLRTGARVVLTPYVVGLIAILSVVALELAVGLVAIAVVLMLWGVIGSLLSGERTAGTTVRGLLPVGRVRGSRLVRTGFLGDTPTGTRIDETGRVMNEGFLGDSPTGIRIDDDGRVMEVGFLGDTPTGMKVDDEGRLVEEGFLGDRPTGTKVDEDGRVVTEGFLGDSPTGYAFRRDG